MGMMVANHERIRSALSEDFGVHPVGASVRVEVLGLLGRGEDCVQLPRFSST